MKINSLPEIAAWMSANGSSFVERRHLLSVQTIGDCYVLSRNRFNRWMRAMAQQPEQPSALRGWHSATSTPSRHPLAELAQQVFLNEMTARVWLSLLVAGDRFHRRNDSEALAKNLISGYQTLRRQTLDMVSRCDSITPRQRLDIQDLRKDTEIWTDLLCCEVMSRYDLWALAFNPDDARHSCQQRLRGGFPPASDPAWSRLLQDLRTSFSSVGEVRPLVHREDRQLLRLMLSTFPPTPDRAGLDLTVSV
ncbi:MAG: hypothetical protein RL215_2765 [Planctomycetota bacterium]